MAIRPRGRQRSLSKKVSSFNMYMDQVYQVRAIMEATGAVKDAPVIRQLLDEALSARRRKAAGIPDWEEPPGQEITETLHTLQTLLLKLIKREELVFSRQWVGLRLLKEAVVEARSGREIVFEELVEKPWMAKGKSKETMNNFFDMKSDHAREYVDGVIARIKHDLEPEENKS
ncbi:MAG TPA: hypothetical protein VJ749_01080 [Pyrinomonadaceae bacterium]|nr:hypothetical protein [Pyrinomonadaceae bacterium]